MNEVNCTAFGKMQVVQCTVIIEPNHPYHD